MAIDPKAFTIKASPSGLLRVLVTDVTIHDSVSGKSNPIKAIWDTGATGSAITKAVATNLGILPTGQTLVSTANGPVVQNTHIVSILLINGVRVDGVLVTEVDALSGGCDALIGMDIITLGDFSITNYEGNTCMSFVIPSQGETDYAKKINNFNAIKESHLKAGLKLTSMCICKSGKKFKNCHGK